MKDLLTLIPQHQQYLGHSLSELQGIFRKSTIQKLQEYEIFTQQEYNLSALDTLFLLNQQSQSLRELAKSVHVHDQTLARIFKRLRMPYFLHKASLTRYFQNLTPEQKDKRIKNAFRASKARSPEMLKENMRRIQQALTPDQRKAYGRMAGLTTQASLTPEQKKEQIKRINLALTPERRRKLGKRLAAYHASMPADKKSEYGRMGAKAQLVSMGYESKREIGRRVMLAYNASLTPLQIEKRKERAIKNLQLLTVEQRRENAKKARQKADLKPNGIERKIITTLCELNIYAAHAKTAQSGQVYYSDTKENRRWIKLRNGKYTIPDFKVKSQKKIIEI